MSVSEHEAVCDTCRSLQWRDDLRQGQCRACRDMTKNLKEASRTREQWLPLSQREKKL